MGFSCGIIGLPNVGKSTLFNALTQTNNAEAANYPFATIEPNIGRVAVPDQRVQKLSDTSKSEKMIPNFLDFVDIAGLVEGASKGEGLGNKFLSHIRNVDAIAHVVRCFEDKNISHINNVVDPIGDIEIINTELRLSDLESLERTKENLSKKIKSEEKEIKVKFNLVSEIINKIENDEEIEIEKYNNNEKLILKELNLIILKPIIYICNVDEGAVTKGNVFSDKVTKKFSNYEVVNISASIESQIANIGTEDEKELILKEYGLNDSALNKVIFSGYKKLNLVTFFTSGPKETRAWTLKKGLTAPAAAGKIHTDFEKGFIRAETISYNDFINYDGEIGCKEKGKMRLEGKEYIVQDGDVFHFLFNV
ncbi:MAG: Ribosome-binding ATPase YchF [Alphaproteobacteria bacterium MarineAlpha5_Bin12]|nr:MAG: Ribosome-binding ATPase YchF [Alphaproteobacteria bacterium MarineAlpha5_Bin12]|tara:strand:+ start:512 stop:1606 length:1095 start_codon:yes stop_codon:yes gene_type:complete